MFHWVTDVERGSWIKERLGPFGGQVSSVMPRGFEAYARVLHRTDDREGTPARWVEVAAAAGTVLHPTAQWWKVARRPDPRAHQPNVAHDEPRPDGWVTEGDRGTRRGTPGEWLGGEPMIGELDHAQLTALAGVLRGFTDPDAVTAGFWEGSGWQGGATMTLWRDDEASGAGAGRSGHRWRRRTARRRGLGHGHLESGLTGPDLDPAALDGPMLELPGRNHIVFACSLDDIVALAGGTATADVTPFDPGRRTPSLLWPDDRAWCVATEVDFDSTLVGGPRALVDAVLADETLEALEVAETASLAWDGDEVN